MAKKPVKITEVVLRDAHQSLLATRMTMDEMRPILPEMDKIPYFSVECWGGATFDSCIRFLDEDPWERLRILRKELPHQKLQMLFRGQNMLGVGKSTMLLQLCGAISNQHSVLYITGEESVRQVKLRAARLKVPQTTWMRSAA